MEELKRIDLTNYDFDEYYNTPYGSAYTVSPEELGHNDDGWFIVGEVITDWYSWVNCFQAFHEDFGFVMGDFEDEVYASSVEAFEHFIIEHSPDCWNYMDI